uniref:2'-deoxynucleoside 5'-phosphate N-hydrolase 1 n=1 Tax=Oryzias latipes TaxID=8090 RepID=A0A3P9IKP3_ORYLA
MKIYFCGSIRGGRDDVHVYRRLVHKLQSYGCVLTEHVCNAELTDTGEAAALEDRVIHDRDVAWLQDSDVIVAEVTQPSLGVGYELGRAVDMKKTVLCLFRPSSGRSLSAMIRGAVDGERFQVVDYSEDVLENVLDEFFVNLKNASEKSQS